MIKGISDKKQPKLPFNVKTLNELIRKGYKYVQIKGVTQDYHYDYVDPNYLLLVPIKDLPQDLAKKDVYADIDSDIILAWARNTEDSTPVSVCEY